MIKTNPKLIIRLGSHAEKEYVLKLATGIDDIIVGANLFEAAPGATASLLIKIIANKCSSYIDPMTYAFGTYLDRDTGDVISDLRWIKSTQKIDGESKLAFKRSYRRLAETIGGLLFQAISSGKAINAIDILKGNNALELSACVIEYQSSRLRAEFEKDSEYKDVSDSVPPPPIVFAPYFYIEPSQLQAWIDANILLMKSAVSIKQSIPVHGVICADVQLLGDQTRLSVLADNLIKSKIAGCWLWFSRFFEHDASVDQLSAYRDLVRKLSASMEVYSLHGGFFSLSLVHHGMTGVSHGVGYGEQKDVVPVIGQSTPTVRYYLPSLRKRIGVPQIERCYQDLKIKTIDDFHKNVCNCVVCKGVVNKSLKDFSAFGELYYSSSDSKRKAQTPAAAKRCRFHFMVNRLMEKSEVIKLGIDGIHESLNHANYTWGLNPTLSDNSNHLYRWIEVI